MKLEFSQQFFEDNSNKFHTKSVQWEPSCSLLTYGTKLIPAFRSFTKVPRNLLVLLRMPTCPCCEYHLS